MGNGALGQDVYEENGVYHGKQLYSQDFGKGPEWFEVGGSSKDMQLSFDKGRLNWNTWAETGFDKNHESFKNILQLDIKNKDMWDPQGLNKVQTKEEGLFQRIFGGGK